MSIKADIELIQRQTQQVNAVRAEIESEICACGRPARPNSDLCYRTYGEMHDCHTRIAKRLLALRGNRSGLVDYP